MKKNEKGFIQTIKSKLSAFDWFLLVPYFLLLMIGMVMIYSSSSYYAMVEFDNSEYYFIRQIIFTILSLLSVVVVSFVSNRLIKSKGLIVFALIVLFLALLYLIILGVATHGANAWIYIGGINIQPMEFLKVVMILYLGVFIAGNQERLANIGQVPQDLKGWQKVKAVFKQAFDTIKNPFLLLIFFLVLVMLQPDMGGVIIIGGISFVMFLLSGISFKLGLGLGGVLGVVYAAFIEIVKLFDGLPFVPAYMSQRFTAFLDPFQDVKDSSFQLVNSFYAIARGGLTGVGLGESIQKSGYLPVAHTDFIIPIIAEELGLIRLILILLVFFYLVYRIYKISMKISDPFGQLVCIGIATMFLIQGTINVGGAAGMLPLTGVTFPFISYGGSSVIVSSVAIGIVNNIYITDMNRETNQQFEKSARGKL